MAKFMLDGREYCGSGSGVSTVKLTQAEYDALSDEKLSNNVIYIITDSDELSAKNVPYDGSVTGLGNNVQSAIDELNSNFGKDDTGMTIHEKLDKLIENIQVKHVEGNVYDVTLPGSSSKTETIVFDKEYLNVPNVKVFLNASTGYSLTPEISDLTTTGFTVTIPVHVQSTCNVEVVWLAL